MFHHQLPTPKLAPVLNVWQTTFSQPARQWQIIGFISICRRLGGGRLREEGKTGDFVA
jgi:hypothetical protein